VLAGKGGLERAVQGISSQDAPTGAQWARGKELLLSTGYFFKDNIEYFKEVIIKSNEKNSSGIGIKVGRYLEEIPEEIIELCNNLNFPLIDLPKNMAWVEIANAINEIVLDRHIKKLTNFIQVYGIKNHDRKIKEIIEGLSSQIGKPVEVYDFFKNRIYSSFDKSVKIAKLNEYEHIWNPNSKHEKKRLSDRLSIFRIKSLENNGENLRTVVPLEIDNAMMACLVVWENEEINDYYDLYVIRLSFILLLHEYGSIYFENSLKDKFQDELIHQIIENTFQNKTQIMKRVLDLDRLYLCIIIRQFNDRINLYEYREKLSKCIYHIFQREELLFGLTGKDEIVMLYMGDKSLNKISKLIRSSIEEVIKYFEKEIEGGKFISGICRDFADIKDIKDRYIESSKAINISKYLYPESKVNFYDDLGAFKFIDISEFKSENIGTYNRYIKPLMLEDDGQELILTLKRFIECNLNYSLTARKLFIHNNTVRYRMNKIKDLINIDWEDSTERLKLEIVLKFIQLFK
jgi:PucR family transcriptional regulator, purine catabolism regulatory protein